nr:MAG TPA: hypothetical protein [Caudoviricetes sp.]
MVPTWRGYWFIMRDAGRDFLHLSIFSYFG